MKYYAGFMMVFMFIESGISIGEEGEFTSFIGTLFLLPVFLRAMGVI